MRFPALCLLTLAAVAADPVNAQFAERGPDGGTTTHITGVELLAIKNAPLMGKSQITWTRALEDGSTVSTVSEANLARDSQGRMYRELVSRVPLNSAEKSRLNEFTILDPVTKTRTVCKVRTRECLRGDYHPVISFRARPTGSFDGGKRYLERQNLGTQLVNGMDTVGTLETLTTYPGVVGNDRALVSTHEFWYSGQLQTNVKVIRKDPTEGTQVVNLIDLSTSEPDPRTFAIPSNYVVHDERTPSRVAPR